MSNLINNTMANKKWGKLPLWFIGLFSIISLITLSTLGLYAYQKKSDLPQGSVQNAQFEILKQQILQQSDVIDTNWLHTLNPLVKEVRGRLLWSSIKQQGIMEFSNLPKLSKRQQYHLSIYDLNAESNKPISTVFNIKDNSKNKSRTLLIPFTASEAVDVPFKFELFLKEKGIDGNQQLLLAQP